MPMESTTCNAYVGERVLVHVDIRVVWAWVRVHVGMRLSVSVGAHMWVCDLGVRYGCVRVDMHVDGCVEVQVKV